MPARNAACAVGRLGVEPPRRRRAGRLGAGRGRRQARRGGRAPPRARASPRSVEARGPRRVGAARVSRGATRSRRAARHRARAARPRRARRPRVALGVIEALHPSARPPPPSRSSCRSRQLAARRSRPSGARAAASRDAPRRAAPHFALTNSQRYCPLHATAARTPTRRAWSEIVGRSLRGVVIVVLSLLMSATGTTESTLIGAFACVYTVSIGVCAIVYLSPRPTHAGHSSHRTHARQYYGSRHHPG